MKNDEYLVHMKQLVSLALEEDVGSGDITTESLIKSNVIKKAHIIAKQKGILCGVDALRTIFKMVDETVHVTFDKHDGDKVSYGDIVCHIKGHVHSILKAERVALNYVGYLSGISTVTNLYVEKIKGTKAHIFDTRKTTPAYRYLEKYAVTIGGGLNQRIGLYDQVLIKDNHLKALGEGWPKDIARLILQVRENIPDDMKIEIEVDTLAQLKDVLPTHPDIILLDNMGHDRLVKAVKIISDENVSKGVNIETEASGGITLDNVREIALSGVDRISIGAITHSSTNIDFSLEVE